MFSARTIRLRFQFRDFFDYPANPHLALFKEDNEEFGDPAGYVVAMVDADDVFRRDVLEYVQKVTLALEPDPIFKRVRSLTSVQAIRGHGDDIASGPLMAKARRRTITGAADARTGKEVFYGAFEDEGPHLPQRRLAYPETHQRVHRRRSESFGCLAAAYDR